MSIIFFPTQTTVTGLQGLLDALSTEVGSMIFIEPGTYVVGDSGAAMLISLDGQPLKIRSKAVSLVGIGKVVFTTNPNRYPNPDSPLFNAIEVIPDTVGGVSGTRISNITLVGSATRLANDANRGISVVDADHVTITNVVIQNFQTGVFLERMAMDERNVGNRVEGLTVVHCDDGIRFNSQEDFFLSDLLEIDGQYIATGPAGDPPHAIYCAGDQAGGKINGRITIRNCVSINHRYQPVYKFRTGTLDVSGLHAQGTGGLLVVGEGASGSFRDLTLSDWHETQQGTADATREAIRILDCGTITIDGAVIRARKDEAGMTGVLVNGAGGTETVFRNVSVHCDTGTGFTPFRVEGSDNVSFVDCRYENPEPSPAADTVFRFEASDGGYVFAPTVKGPDRVIRLIANSSGFLGTLNDSLLDPPFSATTGFVEEAGSSGDCEHFEGEVLVDPARGTTVLVDTGTVGETTISLRASPALDPNGVTVRKKDMTTPPTDNLVKVQNGVGPTLFASLLAQDDWASLAWDRPGSSPRGSRPARSASPGGLPRRALRSVAFLRTPPSSRRASLGREASPAAMLNSCKNRDSG